MTTILAHLTIRPGMEARFEEIGRDMVKQTTSNEEGCIRYEYWRGAEPGKYYVLLAFRDAVSFYEHQASDWHEGYTPALRECFEDIRLEVLDPVPAASPLPPTAAQEVPDDASEAVKRHGGTYRISRQPWWDAIGK